MGAITLLVIIYGMGTYFCLAAAFIGYAQPKRRWAQYRVVFLAASIGFVSAYAIALFDILLDPYWIDNGVRERIPFPLHFVWALLGASMLQFISVPLAVCVGIVARSRSKARSTGDVGDELTSPDRQDAT